MGKDTVSIRIDKDMARFIQEYIEAHPELGYRTLSRFVDDVLRDKVVEIKEKGGTKENG